MKPKERGAKIVGITICAMLILSGVLLVPTPRVSAQGSWTQTTDADFNGNVLNSVRVIGTGVPAYVELNKTDEFSWVNMITPGAPSAREYFAMAYDEYNQVAVLFGGWIIIGMQVIFFDDTWEYDYATNTWTNVTNPASKPTPRFSHKMAYDSTNQVIVMFGGTNQMFMPTDDTWEYNVITKEWNLVSPPTKPGARSDHAMSYDSTNQKVILFGGIDMPPPLGDTWAYDAGANTWNPMPTQPGGRILHDMAYDSTNNVHVLNSGVGMNPDLTPIKYTDTWEYSYPGTWTETTDPLANPGYRVSHAMAFHKGVDRTILFGGDSDGAFLNDTWIYNPKDTTRKWNEVLPLNSPSERVGPDMVYDSTNDVIILFGGTDMSGALNDTWALETTSAYAPGGEMTSSKCDSTEMDPKWGLVSWTSTEPPTTSLLIQLANSTDGSSWGNFVGPDGSMLSYYDMPGGQTIFQGHNGKQYLRYKAFFSTMDNTVSPRLDDITISWGVGLISPRNLVVERTPPNDITLRWDVSPGATEYHIYESPDRFVPWPWALLGNVSAPVFTHVGALVNGTTHFYIVRASDGIEETGNSTMGVKTELTFSQPINPKLTDINWLSLPYNSIYKKASDIANELTEVKIRAVGKWNPAKQRAIIYTYAGGKWRGADFDINPGEGVFIAGLQTNFDWVVTGTDLDPTLDFTYYPKHKKNINWISVPYTGIYNNASSIVMDIEGGLGPPNKIIEVGKWIASTQTAERFYWDGGQWTGTDFTIEPGDGIYIQIITSFSWPIKLLTPPVP